MTLFCTCEHPIFDASDPEWHGDCRRCGLTVTMFRVHTLTDEHSMRVELLARRQELVDRLSPDPFESWYSSDPCFDQLDNQLGSVEPRLVALVVATAAALLAVVLFWHYLVGAVVIYGAFRHLTHGTRRRRPRSSWASNAKAVAAIYAAWNTRGFVQRNGRQLRVSVPAKAGAEHFDYGEGVPF